jgi:PleD family two-component response regulator
MARASGPFSFYLTILSAILFSMKEIIPLSDLRILVVDDSDFSRSMILQMLTEAGCQQVSETNSAESALKLIREKKPHIMMT